MTFDCFLPNALGYYIKCSNSLYFQSDFPKLKKSFQVGHFCSTVTQIFASIRRLPAKLTIVVVAFLQCGHLFATNWSKTGYSFHINHQLLDATRIQWLLTWDRFELVTQEWKAVYPITNTHLKKYLLTLFNYTLISKVCFNKWHSFQETYLGTLFFLNCGFTHTHLAAC